MKISGFFFLLILASFGLRAQVITIAYERDFSPYCFEGKSGEAEGVLIDIYRLWALKTDNEVVFMPCEGNSCIKAVLDGKADLLAGTTEAGQYDGITFSAPIIRLSASLFIREKLASKSIDEFKDSIAFLRSSSLSNMTIDKFPSVNIKIYDNPEEFQKLIDDQLLSAFVIEMPDPTDQSIRLNVPDGYVRYQHLSTIEFRPAVLTHRTELLRSLISVGDLITHEEVIAISKKYNLYLSEKSDYRIIYYGVLGGLLILVIVLLTRNAYLRKSQGFISVENQDWLEIIKQGENDDVEFKSSLRWDYRQETVNKALEKVILKTISAFLNANGGLLFIGIDDEGQILGLQKDYDSFKKANRDGFLLTITSLLNQNFGKDIHRLLKISIVEIDMQDICIVNIGKSEKPIFLGPKGSEEFFVRASASSQPLSMSEAMAYIKEHWTTK